MGTIVSVKICHRESGMEDIRAAIETSFPAFENRNLD